MPSHILELIASIGPAVGMAVKQLGDLLENAILENVRLNTSVLRASSPILSKMATNNE